MATNIVRFTAICLLFAALGTVQTLCDVQLEYLFFLQHAEAETAWTEFATACEMVLLVYGKIFYSQDFTLSGISEEAQLFRLHRSV